MSVPQVQITARDYYVLTKGIPLDAAIAAVAVFYYESRLRPDDRLMQPTEHGGAINPHGAYAIMQLNGPRQQHLVDFATEHTLDYRTLETQLAFALTDMANRYPNCWAAIRSAASFTAIIPILVNEYENPKNKPAEINGALAIARSLAALPPPQLGHAGPTAPATQAPLPTAPPTVPHLPAPLPGLPPISSATAGRRAAQHDYALRMRDVLIEEKAAYNRDIDEEIAGWERMAAVAVTPALPPPIPQTIPPAGQTESTTKMPAILTHILTSWMTSAAGTVAGGPAILDIINGVTSKGTINWATDIPQLATMLVGWLAPDPPKK